MAKRAGLRGHVVLVTGAANGIGLDTARALAARGARLALLDVDVDRVRKEAEALGDNAVGLTGDVTDRPAVDAAVASALDRFGRIDSVVTNAGIGRTGALSAIDESDFQRVIAVNLRARGTPCARRCRTSSNHAAISSWSPPRTRS